MSSKNLINKPKEHLIESNNATDEPVKTFFDAQLAFAKSKQGKENKLYKSRYKRGWYKSSKGVK